MLKIKTEEKYVVQEELELQLKVWKDLAISKQILMRAATDALSLEPECDPNELKAALDTAIKRSIEADANVEDAREKAGAAVAVMEKKMAASEKAQALAEDAKSKMEEAVKVNEQQMAAERTAHIKEMKKIKAQLADKDKAMKAIHTALSDTPENVVKKLKTLKKQKDDEANARKLIEGSAATLRKEKRNLEQRISEMQSAVEESAKLVEQYRELFTLCESMRDQLKPLVEDAKDVPALPAVNEQLLEAVEKAASEQKEKGKNKKEK